MGSVCLLAEKKGWYFFPIQPGAYSGRAALKGPKDQMSFELYEHLLSLRQKTWMILSRYTDWAVAPLARYDYLLEAVSVL